MINKDRQTFLASAAKATEARVARYRAIRTAAQNTANAAHVAEIRAELIAKGVIKPSIAEAK